MPENKIVPIFLVGALRSGTTVAHLMLNSHPNISNPGEYDFFFDYISDDGAEPDSTQMMEQLDKNRVYQFSGLHYDTSIDYRDNLQQFFQKLSNDKEILIINIHRNYHRIHKVFPEAKFLHLLRDPRDVARSSIGMGWAGNVYYGVDHWIDSEKSWDRLAADLEDSQYMEFKFEELILHPDETLTKICNFVGLEFTQHMYDYQNESTYDAPDSKLVSQWKTKLSNDERLQVESKVRPLMRARDYSLATPENGSVGMLNKLFLFIQNKNFKWTYGIKRVGFWNFFAEKLTRKLGMSKIHTDIQKKINAVYQQELK